MKTTDAGKNELSDLMKGEDPKTTSKYLEQDQRQGEVDLPERG